MRIDTAPDGIFGFSGKRFGFGLFRDFKVQKYRQLGALVIDLGWIQVRFK